MYFETRNELLEYGLSIGNIFDEACEGDNERIKEAKSKQRRLNITANIMVKLFHYIRFILILKRI